jgi:hypothetical protein
MKLRSFFQIVTGLVTGLFSGCALPPIKPVVNPWMTENGQLWLTADGQPWLSASE